MYSEDDIQYALENTRVVKEPERRINTFGTTRFHFYLIAELMDSVSEIRVREGVIHAQKPAIIKPSHLREMEFEGFGEAASDYGQWLKKNAGHLAVLQYGFQFRRAEFQEDIVHEPLPAVLDKMVARVEEKNDSLGAVIQGVDDTWEICLLKFSVELIQKSLSKNTREWREDGLL